MKRYIRANTYTGNDIKWVVDDGAGAYFGALRDGNFFMAEEDNLSVVIVDDDPSIVRDYYEDDGIEPWTNEWMEANLVEYWPDAKYSEKTKQFFLDLYAWLDSHDMGYLIPRGGIDRVEGITPIED